MEPHRYPVKPHRLTLNEPAGRVILGRGGGDQGVISSRVVDNSNPDRPLFAVTLDPAPAAEGTHITGRGADLAVVMVDKTGDRERRVELPSEGTHINGAASATRKEYPLVTGLLDYFPDALLEVARTSALCSAQHHPGEPIHWDRAKSTDHADCLGRHLLDRGKLDADGTLHSAKVAWRALAILQEEIEARRKAAKPT